MKAGGLGGGHPCEHVPSSLQKVQAWASQREPLSSHCKRSRMWRISPLDASVLMQTGPGALLSKKRQRVDCQNCWPWRSFLASAVQACVGTPRQPFLHHAFRSALDGPTRANRFADSCESSDSRESPEGSRAEPTFLQIALRGAKKMRIANLRRFARIAWTL